ncbi:hypothetical protein [Paracoccus sp. 22332]|uniref:hypothetical protein n=1 Tax=Paracoccus sp. 22332 TaxID=3453913 RepID=UPI003F84DA5E
MAYAFPLSHGQFMAILPIQDFSFDLPEAIETSETGGGEILRADLGTRLWQGEIGLGEMTPDERDEVMAMLDVLRRPGASFMAHDVRRPAPRLDPAGTELGAAAPQLLSVASTSRDVRLSGLPAGYALRRHDYLAFAYGTNPVRRALHRIASPAVAAANGQTAAFEVSPAVRPGWAAGAAVSLVRAACKAVVVPGSVDPGRRKGVMTTGVRFRFQQTLR